MGVIPTIGIFRLCLTTRPRSKGRVLTLRFGLSRRSNEACPYGTVIGWNAALVLQSPFRDLERLGGHV